MNLIAEGTDSYKQSHWNLYPEGTEHVYSYCEPRVGGRFTGVTFFGLQYIINKYLAGNQVVTRDKINEAAALCKLHFGSDTVFNKEGWELILNRHYGRLPIRIKALREGSTVPEGTCLFTIENTDPRVPWLTNFLETVLMQVWSPTTVCTSSRAIKNIIANYLRLTGDPSGLPFKLHDFGYRGVSSMETAALAGAAHLVNFMGTDTMAALELTRKYYNEPMAGFSIPATEHSIMTAEGPEGEANIVRRILKQNPTGLVAMVIDSYDTINFIEKVIGSNVDIKQAIQNRNGTVVFRPDSGLLPYIDIRVFRALEKVFGSQRNNKNYDVLPPQVRIIQGDGIKWTHDGKYHTVSDILNEFEVERISADNIAFGSGGGLLQDFTRDTQRFAIKCSWMQVNGQGRDIFKQPKTDPTKNSKRGRLAVVNDFRMGIQTIPEHALTSPNNNLLRTVFENGFVTNQESLKDIREQAAL